VKLNTVGAVMMVAGVLSSSVVWGNGLEDAGTAPVTPVAADAPMLPVVAAYQPHVARPAVLPALYATLGAMQVWDMASTAAALKAGAHEANPAAAPFATNRGAMLGLKAATTASTILFAERAWKKNKAAAVVMMVAVNGAMASVAVHNMRNAQMARAR